MTASFGRHTGNSLRWHEAEVTGPARGRVVRDLGVAPAGPWVGAGDQRGGRDGLFGLWLLRRGAVVRRGRRSARKAAGEASRIRCLRHDASPVGSRLRRQDPGAGWNRGAAFPPTMLAGSSRRGKPAARSPYVVDTATFDRRIAGPGRVSRNGSGADRFGFRGGRERPSWPCHKPAVAARRRGGGCTIAQPLVAMADLAGYDVTVTDHPRRFRIKGAFPRPDRSFNTGPTEALAALGRRRAHRSRHAHPRPEARRPCARGLPLPRGVSTSAPSLDPHPCQRVERPVRPGLASGGEPLHASGWARHRREEPRRDRRIHPTPEINAPVGAADALRTCSATEALGAILAIRGGRRGDGAANGRCWMPSAVAASRLPGFRRG